MRRTMRSALTLLVSLFFVDPAQCGSVGARAPDAATLAAMLQQPNCSFVDFYAPWCGHCKSLAPTFEELGALFNGEGQPRVLKVDATDASFGDIVAASGVRSFPYLKLFDGSSASSGSGITYNGPRELAAMVDFINRQCGSKVEVEEADFAWSGRAHEVSAMIADDSEVQCVMLEFYAPWCGHCKSLSPTYEGLAKVVNGHVEANGGKGPRVVKIDGTETQFSQLAAEFEVRGYPTLSLVAPKSPTTGVRERIAYDRRRELPDFLAFLNDECGTDIAIPDNFKPPAARSDQKPSATMQFAMEFNELISRHKYEEGLRLARAKVVDIPRMRTNLDKTERRMKSLDYRILSEPEDLYQFIHPLEPDSELRLIPPRRTAEGPYVAVLLHLELSSPRMKDDLLAVSRWAKEFPVEATFVGLTTRSREHTALSERNRRELIPVAEVEDDFWRPFSFVKDSWDVVVVDTSSRKIVWAGGTHQFQKHTVDICIANVKARIAEDTVEHAGLKNLLTSLTAAGKTTDNSSGDSSTVSTEPSHAPREATPAPAPEPLTIRSLETRIRRALGTSDFVEADRLRDALIELLEKQMKHAAAALEFEEAARLRDRIKGMKSATRTHDTVANSPAQKRDEL